MGVYCTYSSNLFISSLLDIFPEGELLHHRVIQISAFQWTVLMLAIMTILNYIHTSLHQGFPFLCIFASSWYLLAFYKAILQLWGDILLWVLWEFLRVGKAEHLFLTWGSFPCPPWQRGYYILGINAFSYIWIANLLWTL